MRVLTQLGTGRYLTPDPIGYRDGPDAYIYAKGDPLNKIDPTGLYQSDIHYYMTFFLAMAAGVSYEDARTIALAAQYVDDNPITRPLDSSTWYTKVGSIFVNQERLRDYHFVLSDVNGKTIDYYNNSDLSQPGVSPSPQLSNLLNASINAPTTCGRLQFFGEYLHAFEDTFSHRNKDNKPYDAEKFDMGIGHGFDLSNPDYTYDDANGWNMRSARTLAMEEQVFNALLAKYGDPAAAKNWHDIQAVVAEFNAIQESEESEGAVKFQKKFELLDQKLAEWGYQATNLDGSKQAIDLFKDDQYNKDNGETNRIKNLCDKDGKRLKQEDYPGTILPTTECQK